VPKTSPVERVVAQNQEAKENFFPFQSKQIEDESHSGLHKEPWGFSLGKPTRKLCKKRGPLVFTELTA